MERYVSFLLAVLILPLSYCGKKGPIYPPLERIPKEIESFNAIQRGNGIVLTWNNPEEYIDGSPLLYVKEIELWLLEEKKKEQEKWSSVSKPGFEDKAELLVSIPEEKLQERQYIYRFKTGDLGWKRLTFSIRVKDYKDKNSDFSKLISIEPKAVPRAPREFKAELFSDRIVLTWNPPDRNVDGSSLTLLKGYNVYRAEGEEGLARLNSGVIKKNSYEDTHFVFGNNYQYKIRAAVTDESPYLESEDSEPVHIQAKDIFAPASPKSLTAISGRDFITLSWIPNQERDLAGYKVWRKQTGDKDFLLLTPEFLREAAYTDHSAVKGIDYEYAVSACDTKGNESPRSESILAMISGRDS